MFDVSINYWAVLLAPFVSVGVGVLWYGKSGFGKQWMALVGKTQESVKSEGMHVGAYVTALVSALILAFVLATFVGLTGATSLAEGIQVGFWTWLGFVPTTALVNGAFAGRSKMLAVIDSGNFLVFMLVMGAILSVWQ
ncbi:MAG: DUF1761 domain-containing protein [Candidatus Moranbacteria bacterium]|nr:DUF1761 domain-containing protein [Candidatus Moranbacteria bacterium]